MPGGRGKINEYNKMLTQEQRKANAKRAAKESLAAKYRKRTMREWAIAINSAPANADLRNALQELNVPQEEIEESTNAAGAVLGIFRRVVDGDTKAFDAWRELIGENAPVAENGIEDDALSKSLKELASELESDD